MRRKLKFGCLDFSELFKRTFFNFLSLRTEPQIFKSKFCGWDDVLPVDYTRTSESIARRGADMKVCFPNETYFSVIFCLEIGVPHFGVFYK